MVDRRVSQTLRVDSELTTLKRAVILPDPYNLDDRILVDTPEGQEFKTIHLLKEKGSAYIIFNQRPEEFSYPCKDGEAGSPIGVTYEPTNESGHKYDRWLLWYSSDILNTVIIKNKDKQKILSAKTRFKPCIEKESNRQLTCEILGIKPCPVDDFDPKMEVGDVIHVSGLSQNGVDAFPQEFEAIVDGSGYLRVMGKENNANANGFIVAPFEVKAAGRSFLEVEQELRGLEPLFPGSKPFDRWKTTWTRIAPRKVYIAIEGRGSKEIDWKPGLTLSDIVRTSLGNLPPGAKDEFFEASITPREGINSAWFLVSRYNGAIFPQQDTGKWMKSPVRIFPSDQIWVSVTPSRVPGKPWKENIKTVPSYPEPKAPQLDYPANALSKNSSK
jgi:hypothetical protein